jgi:hypothetical protein
MSVIGSCVGKFGMQVASCKVKIRGKASRKLGEDEREAGKRWIGIKSWCGTWRRAGNEACGRSIDGMRTMEESLRERPLTSPGGNSRSISIPYI